MPNMSLKKNEMPSQEPNVRNKNFLEVALGYTEEQALDEAARCLNCKNHPCVSGCPVQVKIPEFIKKITEKDYEGAYQVIHETSSLPAVCGRVCPQETQCESKCIRGIKGEPVGIGRLERFVADWHNANVQEAPAKPAPNGHKVAVIGSGPSGLTRAVDAAKTLSEKYGIEADVINMPSLVPLDYTDLIASVKKTGRVVLASDACARGTFLNEIAENLTNMCFDYLDAPPVVIGARNWITPPHEFDKYFFPYAEWIIDAVNARLIPLEGYTSTTTPDEAEIIRRNKLGV